MSKPRHAAWLTVAQVCADLQVTEAEWTAWREAGDTPLHVALPDGQFRVRAVDYDRWLESLADDGAGPEPARFAPLSAYWRDRIREAIDATGPRGLGRAEIWALTNRIHTLHQINDALAEMVNSGGYEEFTVRTGEPGRPPVRYRRCNPSCKAAGDASHAARADASPPASRDASPSTAAEREGSR